MLCLVRLYAIEINRALRPIYSCGFTPYLFMRLYALLVHAALRHTLLMRLYAFFVDAALRPTCSCSFITYNVHLSINFANILSYFAAMLTLLR